ncbi:hypothetical protein PED38_10585 [Clavibacter sp. CT19]|uniref:hypothetical protein n=1 Tax=Clavibacter sp. CT19 TaxID=3018990 RepID=UPI0022EB94A5|nr:hypothetical protein [Clavibacter sp. CT19]MDA3805246.1 hypothetical protein [Clavibacter sp. CT19]
MRITRGTADIHRHGALVAAGLATLLLAGCTGGSPEPDAATTPAPAAPSSAPDDAAGLADPRAALTIPGSGEPPTDDLQAALQESGTGPTTFEVPQPDASVGALRFAITCTSGEYRVRIGAPGSGSFYGSGCSPTGANTASIPIPQRDAPLTVTVEIAEGIPFRIVAVPA